MSDARDDRRPLTQLAQAGRRADWTGMPGQPGAIVSPPVWRASTILYDDVAHLRKAAGSSTHERLFYGRKGTPTSWSLAEALTEMEPGAEGTMLFPSGVAAIACALMAVLRPGDQLLMVDSAYDPTRNFCEHVLRPFGVETIYYDPTIGAGIADLVTDRTRAIFLECPGSLTFEVQDVPAITAIARDRGITTLLDNTWATPLFFPALAHGVDIAILACTKYIVGHSDVMMGSVTATPALFAKVRQSAFLFGQMTSPDDAWLASRGLRTLGVRLAQHQASALQIARWLAEQPGVARVLHPALPDCPGHDLWTRDFSGSSGLFSFVLDGGDEAARAALIDGLAHFGIGYSWGGFESLALPVDPARYRTATSWQAAGPVIRLQIGLEDPADLIADLDAGLARFRAARGMNRLIALLDHLPGDADITQPLIALGTALLLYALAYAAARAIATRVHAAFPALNDTVAAHVRPMIRHAIAALLLGIAAALWPQDSLAHLVIGVFLGASIALFATHLLHSLAIPRWAIVPLALLLFIMVVSGSSGGIAPVGQMLDQVGVDLGKRRISLLDILSMAATVVALLAGIRLANRLIGHSIQKAADLDPTQKLLGQKLASIAVVVAAFFIGVDVLSIDLTAFTVFSGALGLAVGFGLQKTVGNLIAGIILLMDRSIKPGDVIVVGDSFGWVNKIGVRAVSVVTRDGKEHLIPNENLMTQEVENWSYSDRNVRIRIPVGISYDSDRKLAQELMLQAALESPRVLRSPRPNVWLINLGEYRLDHEIRVWISDPESGVGNVTSDVLGRVLDKFAAHGIIVPYPQRIIEIRPDPAQPQ